MRSPLAMLMRVNFWQATRRLQTVQRESRLLTSVILGFIVGYFALAFYLFQKGLNFLLRDFPGFGTLLAERLIFLLFAFLFVLLLLSNLIISYTNFFRNRETVFLLSLPVSTKTIFRWKFIEASLLASWAFLFLIAPLLVAFGLTSRAPWHFYIVSIVSTGLFIVLPAIAGAWISLNLARFLDRRAFQTVAILAAVVLLFAAAYWLHPEPIADDPNEVRVLAVMDRLMLKTQFAHSPFLPSYWMSTSILQWAEGGWKPALFFILVLLSYVLFFGYLSFTRMGKTFYDAFSVVHSRASVFEHWQWFRALRSRRNVFGYSQGLAEGWLQNFRGAGTDVRALILKDLRIFWRDTTQWGQTVVLFGLLGVYIINLRHFTQQLTNPFWIHLVSYLNLGACSLNLATLTTRFVYPQFSLEGKRLWIVGMAPIGLTKVVKVKFWLATLASLCVTLGLISLSCHMLQMPLERTLFFAGTITIMTFTLNGLAMGLGVLYPNFREDNPSKIVSGFGGTFCLVLSFVYIVGSVVLLSFGAPWRIRADEQVSLFRGPSFTYAVIASVGFLLFSLLLGQLPLQLGLRKVAKFEM
jgi:ABC-2 type transport system permease protein